MASLPNVYSDFTGGLNTKDQAFLLVDNQARDLSNVQGTAAGAIVKRNGLVTFATPPVVLTSLTPFDEVSPVQMVAAGGTALYSVSAGGTVASIKTGLTTGKHWEFVEAPANGGQGPIWGMNGTDTPQQWDGVAAGTSAWTATSGSVPNGKYCLVHQNQVFVAGVSATPSRVFWSGLQAGVGALPRDWDPTANNGAGAMDFDPNDGQVITGLGRVGPYVLVCKPRKLWILVDPTSATVRRLADNVGCVAHRSIASGPVGTYFLSEDRGVHVTNGSKVTPISDKVLPTIQSVQGSLSQAAGACFSGHYYLSLPLSSGTNDTTLDWDETLGSWWKHSFGQNQFAIWHPTGTANLYGAKATSAVIDLTFAANTFQDNGANFTWAWRGPWQSPSFFRRRRFPTPYYRKRLRQVRIEGAGHCDFYLAKNFAAVERFVQSDIFSFDAQVVTWSDPTVTWSDPNVLWGSGPVISSARIQSQGVANAFSLVFAGTTNAPASVNEYTLVLTDRRDGIQN